MVGIASRNIGVGLLAAIALCAANVASALTLGPSLSLDRVVALSDPSPLYAIAWTAPIPGVPLPDLRGQVQISPAPGTPPSRVIGISYLTSDSGQFDRGSVSLTTVFGTTTTPVADPGDCLPKLNPCDPTPVLRVSSSGWDCGGCSIKQPNIDPLIWTGSSALVYAASPAVPVTLANLPTALGSGFDLSPFAGDPAGVFLVLRTDLPAAELLSAVPEPGSAALLVAGLALLARRSGRWRVARPSTVSSPATQAW